MTLFVGAEQQGIGHRGPTRRRLHIGVQHQGVGPIAPRDIEAVGGSERPVSRLIVEQPSEHRRRVEPWEAQPVDRAIATRRKRGGVAVRQERVVGKRTLRHRRTIRW